jgi:four helix bundle protein
MRFHFLRNRIFLEKRRAQMQFSQTKIYRKTMDLIDLSQIILRDLPSGYGFLADQLRRAASSIPLNFAEGYGKRTPKEQRRFFMIARGSTNEVAAILDVGLRLKIINKTYYHEGMELCDHLARMLTCFRRF